MGGARVIRSATLVSGGVARADAWVRMRDGRVEAVGMGDGWRAAAVPGEEVVDAAALAGEGAVLAPGFVDVHGHGGAGVSYDDGVEAIRAARAMHTAHGTTRAVLSLVSAPVPELRARLAVVADVTGTDGVLGAHLEGPFLDPGHRGAHDPVSLRLPDPGTIDALLEAGRGTVRQATVAPELPGGLDAVRRLAAAGVAVAVGHTDADADAATAAFDAGATLLTHAFNAMPGLGHRAPGPVGAAASDPRVTLEVIADGVHLDTRVVRIAFAAAPDRIALVTDAMAAAGASDGRYRLGSRDVEVRGGVARLPGADTIAGSTLTQAAALRIAVAAGVPLPAAIEALTATPARAVGRPDLGVLEPGSVADAVLLAPDLHVARVWSSPLP